MTKSQNTKNEQQKDLCITSEQLTEQWKKGELPSGWFWVEGCRDKEIYAYTSEYLNHMYRPKNSDRIIEQVPSYEEWEQLQNWADFTNDYHELREKLEIAEYKNAQLKELLKECRHIMSIEADFVSCHFEKEKLIELIERIDEALK